MKHVAITMLFLTLASCSGTKTPIADPIDTLITRLNASHGLWINGLHPDVNLPPDAKPEEVLAAAFKVTGFDRGHIKSFKIQSVRQVELIAAGQQTFSIALVDSDLGQKIFLFKPERNNRWWTRFYDVEEEKQYK